MAWDDLPEGILLHVFELLLKEADGHQLVSIAGQVCKAWHEDAQEVLLRDTAVSGPKLSFPVTGAEEPAALTCTTQEAVNNEKDEEVSSAGSGEMCSKPAANGAAQTAASPIGSQLDNEPSRDAVVAAVAAVAALERQGHGTDTPEAGSVPGLPSTSAGAGCLDVGDGVSSDDDTEVEQGVAVADGAARHGATQGRAGLSQPSGSALGRRRRDEEEEEEEVHPDNSVPSAEAMDHGFGSGRRTRIRAVRRRRMAHTEFRAELPASTAQGGAGASGGGGAGGAQPSQGAQREDTGEGPLQAPADPPQQASLFQRIARNARNIFGSASRSLS